MLVYVIREMLVTAYPEGQTRSSQPPGALPPESGPPGVERPAIQYKAIQPAYAQFTPSAPAWSQTTGRTDAETNPAVHGNDQTSPKSATQPATAEAEDSFLGDGHRQIAGVLRRALAGKRAFVAVTGAQGVGKTTVLAAVVASPGLPLRDISISQPDQVTADVIAQIEQVIRQSAGLTPEGERRTALIVDNAHEASVELLRYLTRVAVTGRLDPHSPQVILVGRPELWDRLAPDEFAPLAERITIRPVMQPLTEADARGLVRHLLNQPRTTSGRVLATEAEREFLNLGQGNPARIKAMMGSMIMLDDLRAHPPISIETVRSAAAWVDGVRQGRRWKRSGAWLLALVVAATAGTGVALAARGWPLDRVLTVALDVAGRASQWRTPMAANTARPPVEAVQQTPTGMSEAAAALALPGDASHTAPAQEPASAASPPTIPDGADMPVAGGDPSAQPAWPGPSPFEAQGQPVTSVGSPSPLPDPLPTTGEMTPAGVPGPVPVTAPRLEPPETIAPSASMADVNLGSTPSSAPTPPLSPGMIATLLRRGDEMLALSDVAAARRYYERTVPANSALGARGVARTYDPVVLGRDNTAADRAAALAWYGIAAALGDAEANTLRQNLEETR